MTEHPVTPAVRLLREKHISFVPHLYVYEEHGGTKHSAAALHVDEHAVIKTLVMETDGHKQIIVLMHGDREVSTKQLSRFLNVKHVQPCDETTARKHTGYQFGGTSPLGTRTHLPVYAESTIFSLPRIFINGGKRGFLLELNPTSLQSAMPIQLVSVSRED